MSMQTPKILTIDDEPLVRESIVAFLEDSGFEVIEASNGREGLDLYHQHLPDVILCDLHMPVLGGLEVLSALKAEGVEVPFIVVSGAGVVHDAVDALRMGAWDYIVKPITDMGTLEHAVAQALERSRLIHQNNEYRAELEATNRDLKESLSVLKEDQEAGRRIQFQLLPKKDWVFENITFNHHLIPSLYLSGDFVDYFQIDEQHVGFYIADVSGHGAPSAFVTVLLKSLVDQFLNAYHADEQDVIIHPAQLLGRLNAELLKVKLGKYLTMIYGVLDLTTDKLIYSIGGHFPNPVLVTFDKKPFFLEGKGFPVGVFSKAEYEIYTIDLPKRFCLLLSSDGVLEILKYDTLDEKQAFLLDMVDKSTATTIAQLLDELHLNGVTGMPDDITFLVVSRG